MINSIDIKWDLLGAKLANLSDEEQGLFFKGLSNELSKFESHYMANLQMCYVKSKLSKKEQEFLKEFLPNLWED